MMSEKDGALSRMFGIRYAKDGRDSAEDGGLDCYGFARKAYEALGMPVPPEYVVSDIGARESAWNSHASSDSHWKRLAYPESHCFVLLRNDAVGTHCGILLYDCRNVIHCNMHGVRIDSINALRKAGFKEEFYSYEE